MFKIAFVLVIYFLPFSPFAQGFSALREGFFSFYSLKNVVESHAKIYATAQNAIFSYNNQTRELDQIKTIQRLSGKNISDLYYSDMYVGYENGLIEIVFDNDEKMLTINGILISEEGITEGLLQQIVSDIDDGYNNKWIGIGTSGIHLVLISDLDTFETKGIKLKVVS